MKRIFIAITCFFLFLSMGCSTTHTRHKPRAIAEDETVIYAGHDTQVLHRLRGDNEVLIVLTPSREHVIGSLWMSGIPSVELQTLDDDGELLVCVYRRGGGTGLSQKHALVVLFRDDQAPAVAELWHDGYCQTSSSASTFQVVEHIGYQVQGNALTSSFSYYRDEGVAVHSAETWTDTVELLPGRKLDHQCDPMIMYSLGHELPAQR